MGTARERLLAAASGLDAARAARRPAGGGWSPVQILDHLATAEGQLVRGFGKLARGERPRVPRYKYFYRLPIAPVFWNVRYPAPRPVRPKATSELDLGTVLTRLKEGRAAFLAVVDTVGEERFSRLILPHPVLGRFDGLDWLRFVALHETKHACQLERSLAG